VGPLIDDYPSARHKFNRRVSCQPPHQTTPPYAAGAPTISAHDHVVTGTGFLADHNVTIRITRPGDDISDYLAYVTDSNGHLDAELPTSALGTLHIAATGNRPDPDGTCGRLWSNTYILVEHGP
jgi:hypothetical protein